MKTLFDKALSKDRPEPLAYLQKHDTEETPDDKELQDIVDGLKLSIKVVGCGGGGSNTITRLAEEHVTGCELIALNTDARHLVTTHAHRKILIGKKKTRGLGAGGDPTAGEESAREEDEELKRVLQNAHIVFVTCGLGGGTGTGSAPYVAQMAKQMGALTVVFATKPFKGEGINRSNVAEAGLDRLASIADTVITISNDKLLEISPKLPLNQAFKVLDELLMDSIKAIVEMMTKPGLMNVDYNDLRTIMAGGGVSVIALATTDEMSNRADDVVNKLLNCPLLEYDITNASGLLVKVSGGEDMSLQEAERVPEILNKKINPNARIIWGASVEPEMEKQMKVFMVVTGITSKHVFGKGKGPQGATGGLGLDQVR